MTKNEFLTELRNNLKGLPKDEIEDRLNFYEEMINDRMDEGKSEEEAVADIGTTDEAVRTIASQTKMSTLVKEKMRAKKSISGGVLVLLALGFPLWFPLFLTLTILALVGYFLTWILVIVTYSTEAGLLAGFGAGTVGVIASIIDGNFSLLLASETLMCLGGACLFILLCILATKVTLKLSRRIFTGIKSKIIKGRN